MAPSKNPTDRTPSQPGKSSWLARATRTWPKDPDAPRWGRNAWRSQAHQPLLQIGLWYLVAYLAVFSLIFTLIGIERSYLLALLMAVAATSGLLIGIARTRAKQPD